MLSCIKKIFTCFFSEKSLFFSFLAYFVMFCLFIQGISYLSDILFFGIYSLLFVILTLFFFSGWFMVLNNSLLEDGGDTGFVKTFLEGIKNYIIPLFLTLLLFIFLFFSFNIIELLIADKFIGKIDFLFESFNSVVEPLKYSIDDVISNLSQVQTEIFFKREILFIVCAFLFHSLTLFLVPALYDFNNTKKSSFFALKKSFMVFIKKPFVTMVLTLLTNIITLFLMFLVQFLAENLFYYIFYMILTTALAVFTLVLIFCYYERTFENCCHNGADCIRQE